MKFKEDMNNIKICAIFFQAVRMKKDREYSGKYSGPVGMCLPKTFSGLPFSGAVFQGGTRRKTTTVPHRERNQIL